MTDDSPPEDEGEDDETGAERPHMVGNDHAEGNPGGSGQPGNQNATRHGLYSEADHLLEHLDDHDPEAREWVAEKFEGYLREAPFGPESPKADQLLQVCTREYSIWQATGLQIREGVVKTQAVETGSGEWITAEKEHAVNMPLDRMEKTVTKRLKELGVLGDNSPQQQQQAGRTMESEDYVIHVSSKPASEVEDESDLYTIKDNENDDQSDG